ncbi:hypothetical protein KC19_6G070900 [Ceratodon purpureus]|uniref:Uncharacterized protein n=1 Tax=Ceratodon purpureus TaxID=3225 RepID=A0A8T0HFV2_CERPU|nr:hypothetical protein KC19_6G070900 [Ceratodon purpureus]
MSDESAKMVQISMEAIACEGVLQNVLKQMARGWDPWELLHDDRTRWWKPPTSCTFEDVKNVRAVSKLWRDHVDGSPEYAIIRLVRWDYDQEEGVPWISKEEYLAYMFKPAWNLFSRSWRMVVPIADDRLRTLALADLSCSELDQLRMLLIGDRYWNPPGNTPVLVAEGEKIQGSPSLWVAQAQRA